MIFIFYFSLHIFSAADDVRLVERGSDKKGAELRVAKDVW